MPLKTTAAICALAVFLTLFTPASAAPFATPTAFEVIAAVNALRASYGLPPYLIDPILMMAAQMQTDYLASTTGIVDGHTGPGGTDPDMRAHNLGYPEVQGLDINENWCTISVDDPLETLIYRCWGDEVHMHTMLHDRGQHAGAGVSVSGERVYIVLDVAAYWGDAGLTAQPTTSAYGGTTAGSYSVSQYIAPVSKATTAPDGSITHIVMSGQSLWLIAHHYAVDLDRIRQLNYLGADDMIYIGQKVLIQPPSPATPTANATATIQTPSVSQTSTKTIGPWENTPEDHAGFTPSPVPQSTQQDESGWFLAFFGLFGAGVVLVVLSLSTKR
jgi:uncharacterized protein YkwD